METHVSLSSLDRWTLIRDRETQKPECKLNIISDNPHLGEVAFLTAPKHWENSGKLRTSWEMKRNACDLMLGCSYLFLNLRYSILTSLNLPGDKNMIDLSFGIWGTLRPECDTLCVHSVSASACP